MNCGVEIIKRQTGLRVAVSLQGSKFRVCELSLQPIGCSPTLSVTYNAAAAVVLYKCYTFRTFAPAWTPINVYFITYLPPSYILTVNATKMRLKRRVRTCLNTNVLRDASEQSEILLRAGQTNSTTAPDRYPLPSGTTTITDFVFGCPRASLANSCQHLRYLNLDVCCARMGSRMLQSTC